MAADKEQSGVSPRRANMQANRSKDTGPELVVRRLLHGMGYRYRLHLAGLPGRPDLVFPGRRRVIEVRGCYWHGHGCRLGQPARSNPGYWGPKIEGNRARDARNLAALRREGWEVAEVWECQVREGGQQLRDMLVRFLEGCP